MNRGGAETLIMNLYRNIDRARVQYDFLTCAAGVFDAEIAALGGNVHRIPYITQVGLSGYVKELEAFFARHRYGAVHSHMDKMSGLVLGAAQRAGIPMRIAHSHNTRSEGSGAVRLVKWYAGRKIERSATHLLACSAAAAEWLYKGRAKEAVVVNNGIDSEVFRFSPELRRSVRAQLGFTPDQHIIGHVGRFNHQKNHSFLLDIFAEIVKRRRDCALVLVGDGPLRAEIQAKAAKLKMEEQIKFLGIRADIPGLLQAFDVMVFPSLHEGLPVSLIEAQGSGLPCVLADTITREVDLGAGLVQFERLQSPPSLWAEKALQRRERAAGERDYVREKGFDIRGTADWLQNFYLSQTLRAVPS
jgi:glycosyltransferase involved in cell wall biosynthesis